MVDHTNDQSTGVQSQEGLLHDVDPSLTEANKVAKALDVDVHVIEMGYLRPDWVTFERDGMSSNSRFPRNPQQIKGAHGY